MEAILGLDPDVLLLGFEPNASLEDVLDAYPHLASLRAVREGHVVLLPPRELTTVSPFLVDSAEELAERLHPGLARKDAP